METELEILKKIAKNKKPAHIRLISIQTGFGIDYVRYICKNLLEKELVKKEGRDKYSINRKGQKELEKRGLIRQRGVFQSSQICSPAFAKLALWKPKEIRTTAVVSNKIKEKSNFEVKEEKLTIGKKVEKAIKALKNLKRYEQKT